MLAKAVNEFEDTIDQYIHMYVCRTTNKHISLLLVNVIKIQIDMFSLLFKSNTRYNAQLIEIIQSLHKNHIDIHLHILG